MFLLCNQVIEWFLEDNKKTIERILWIENECNRVIVINIETKNALPYERKIKEVEFAIQIGDAHIIQYDSDKFFYNEKDLSEANRKRRDHAWEIIRDLVSKEPEIYYPRTRGRLINEILNMRKTTKAFVYDKLRLFWQKGKNKNALLPNYNNCGGKDRKKKAGNKKRGRPRKNITEAGIGINITPDVEKKFQRGYDTFYKENPKLTIKQVYDLTITYFFNIGYELVKGVKTPITPPKSERPSEAQYRQWFEKKSLSRRLIDKKGKRKYQLENRPVLGDSTVSTIGPGSLAQIDATIGNVYIVSKFNRNRILERPVIYTLIDVFSRYIMGIYIGIRKPSWIGAMMAICNAGLDKVKFCKEYGIDIVEDDWCCSYVPETIIGDRGEMEGKASENLQNVLNVTVDNTPPFRADWKGIVEKYFDVLDNDTSPMLPGAVTATHRERGTPDHRLGARLTLEEYTKIIIKAVLFHNNAHVMKSYKKDEFMIHDDIVPISAELWKWGLCNRTGRLRQFSEDILRLNLMPMDQATVTYRGIRYNNQMYGCDLALQEEWYTKARNSGSWNVDISYDPRNMDNIYIRLERGKKFEPCYQLEQMGNLRGASSYEIEAIIEDQKKQFILYEDKELQERAHLYAFIDDVNKKAEEQFKESEINQSNASRLKDIHLNTAVEKAIQDAKEAWVLDKDSKTSNKIIEKDSMLVEDEIYIEPVDYLSET
ncbi:MAG: Mu transposase C-terminal domain-containing protein [Bacillota bacterium]